MRRRRQTSWIHRRSRYLIGGIATTGAVLTGYLTAVKFAQAEAACPISGCEQVLSSDYATVLGLPLTLFGCLAYLSMAAMALAPLALRSEKQQELRLTLENWTWNLLFLGGTAMMIFSGYLMYLLTSEIKSFCLYCVGSALLSTSLFVLSVFGKSWEDTGKLIFNGILVGLATLIATLGVYASPSGDTGGATNEPTVQIIDPAGNNAPPRATTQSGEAELALADHLQKIGAKSFGAWWCPHCFEQRQLLGQAAYKKITSIECDPGGVDPQPQVCQASGVQSYPSWEINDKLYAGVQEPQELAAASGYKGPMNFKYTLANIPQTMPKFEEKKN